MRHIATILRTDRPLARASRTAVLAAMLGTSIVLSPAALAQESTPVASPAASPVASPVAQEEIA